MLFACVLQQRFLKEAQSSVKKNAYFMRKAMVGRLLAKAAAHSWLAPVPVSGVGPADRGAAGAAVAAAVAAG